MFDDQGRALDIAAKQWHFNNAAGIGFDADVCVKVLHSDVSDRLSRLHLSQLAYLCAALPGFLSIEDFLYLWILMEKFVDMTIRFLWRL